MREGLVRRYRLTWSLILLLAVAPLQGCALLAAGVAGGAAAGAVAAKRASEHQPYDPIIYAGTVVANAGYLPVKILFAGGGAAASGVMYLMTRGDSAASAAIWNASVQGD